jgi:hypothetical protein
MSMRTGTIDNDCSTRPAEGNGKQFVLLGLWLACNIFLVFAYALAANTRIQPMLCCSTLQPVPEFIGHWLQNPRNPVKLMISSCYNNVQVTLVTESRQEQRVRGKNKSDVAGLSQLGLGKQPEVSILVGHGEAFFFCSHGTGCFPLLTCILVSIGCSSAPHRCHNFVSCRGVLS